MIEEKLKGRTVAIVGLGRSWFEYCLAKSHGHNFDEVWAINAVSNVIYHDRVFMLDPASRFLDTDDAGGQTSGMTEVLLNHKGPIYTCELDDRCPGLIEYPIKEVVSTTNCHYLNNTTAYAVAFALYQQVGTLKLFGVDFSYKENIHFAESGRACTEFWLSKCSDAGMQIEVAKTSGLLDADVPDEEKLYGYHRLADPLVPVLEETGLTVRRKSEAVRSIVQQENVLIDRYDSHLKPPEPKKW